MGFAHVTVRVYGIDLTKWEEVEVLVDSGALLTSIPRSVLERLGFKPITRRKLRVYSGGLFERDIGGVVVEYEGQRTIAPVIFGEEGDMPVLGVTALEALGYQIDPISKKLKPTDLLMV
jgi:aspartyl protease family protein